MRLFETALISCSILNSRCVNMPGPGPRGRAVVVSVNLSSASLSEDLNPHRQESSGKTSRSYRGRFCESLERISQRGSKTTQPKMQWTDLIRPAMTQRDGDPHKIDYTRVEFETLSLARHWRAIQRILFIIHQQWNHSRTHCSFFDLEPNNTQRAPDGSALVWKFSAP